MIERDKLRDIEREFVDLKYAWMIWLLFVPLEKNVIFEENNFFLLISVSAESFRTKNSN